MYSIKTMGGGLMQLVAYGAQDIYLTGNPQITFFKVVYRRHTNFSMESIQQTFSGGGNNVVATISRNGDLVHKMYLAGPEGFAGPIIKTAELEIGGQRIDRQSGDWMDTWNELSTSESKAIGLKAMTGQIGIVGIDGVQQQHIPLLFWFCRNPGLALPLIALQYHEVKVKFSFDLTNTNTYTLYCDYIYLDTDERRRFAQVSHEYLIEQVQEQTSSTDGKNKLNFNHPVKELIWRSTGPDPAETVGLKLNGHERFSTRNDEYFYLQQPYDYHTAVPRQNLPTAAQLMSNSVIFQNTTTFLTSALGVAATGTVAGGLQSEGIGAETNDIVVPTSGTFKYGQTNVNFNEFDVATTFGTEFTASAGAANIAFLFNAADSPAVNFAAGHTYRIKVSGGGSVTGGATSKVVITRVDAVVQGLVTPAGGGDPKTLNVDTFAVFFSELLTLNAAGAMNGGGPELVKIESVEKIIYEAAVITQARTSKDTAKIGVYSFALKPEEHQPSGTCNFSRIDNAELTFTGSDSMGTGVIYAVNYNVLRIMSGMGGLAYSN